MDFKNSLCQCGKLPIRVVCTEPTCQQSKVVCYKCVTLLHIDHEESMMIISDFEKLVTQENLELASISDSQFKQSSKLTNQIQECYQLIKVEILKAIDKWYDQVQQHLDQQTLSILITQVKEKKHTPDTIEQIMKSIKINNGKCEIRQKDYTQGLTMVINMINHSQSFCQRLNNKSKILQDKLLELINSKTNSQTKVTFSSPRNHMSTQNKGGELSFQQLDQGIQRNSANLKVIGSQSSVLLNPIGRNKKIVQNLPLIERPQHTQTYHNQNQVQKNNVNPNSIRFNRYQHSMELRQQQLALQANSM